MSETETSRYESDDDDEERRRRRPSNSDSDSDEVDVDDMEVVEKEVKENPSNYEAHIKYIRCLRKNGEIEKLREAREAMNVVFPMSPMMWREWCNDEARMCNGDEDIATIEKLYERGVHEYLSVPLWCDYMNYVKDNDPLIRQHSEAGLLKMRELFERSLTAAGLHVAEGNKLWEAYIDFEMNIHQTIDVSDSEERNKQVQRVRSIFNRQLSVPLSNSSSTLLTYKAWEVEQGSSSNLDAVQSNVLVAHEKALEMYNARIHHEEQICRQEASDTEKLQEFMAYLKFEQSSGDPARVQILFERAVTELPVASDVWLEYTRFLDHTLKVPKVAVAVYSRAVRNCTWIGELWICYLLTLELAKSSEEVISAVYEKSLQCAFPSFTEYLDIFLTRIDGLRRRLSQASLTDGVLDYSLIRNTFQHAVDYVSPHISDTEDFLRLHVYWSRLELKLGKDLRAARGVWESFLKTSGSVLEAWRCYIAMEIELGHTNEARLIYKRCYCRRFSGTGSEDICYAWLRFEREFGNLEDYYLALRKVTPRLKDLELYRFQQESKGVPAVVALKDELTLAKVLKKRKTGTEQTDEKTAKRHKAIPPKASEVSEKENITSAEPKDETKSNLKPETQVNAKLETKFEQQTTYPSYTDRCTVFISNINLEAKSEDIRKLFSDVGGVTAIRLLSDKFTKKSRGLAYVDFSDEYYLKAALEKNKQILLGKKLSIARSNPKQGKKKESYGRSSNDHDQQGRASENVSGKGDSSEKRLQFSGKNTFAIPRNLVKPLGYTNKDPKKIDDTEENPKSNDEFRKLFLKN